MGNEICNKMLHRGNGVQMNDTCATANSVKNRTEVKYRTKTFLTLKFIFFSVDSDLLGPF